MFQQIIELRGKGGVLLRRAIFAFQIEHERHERFGDIAPAELTKMAAFVGSASKELRWAVGLALHTGLRQSDLIRLPWGAFDGTSFIDRTSKTRRDVLIPAGPECQALMRSIEKRHLIILTTQRGKSPWTADGLRSSFRKACAQVGIKKTFHDLRRTACTNLLCAGVEASKVAMIMGWSEDEVEALKRKYVSRAEVVKAVLAQLEKGR